MSALVSSATRGCVFSSEIFFVFDDSLATSVDVADAVRSGFSAAAAGSALSAFVTTGPAVQRPLL